MENKPIVSIIVPNYNHARFLPQRWESIVNQTFQDFEIILLDDCSQDNSQIALKEFATHPKVSHYVCNDKNSGSPFSQWRKGLRLARGKYVWIAESDDVAKPEFLEHLAGELDRDRGVSVAYSRSQSVGASGEALWGDYFWPDDLAPARWRRDFKNDGPSEIKQYLKFRNTIPNASSSVFRRPENFEDLIPDGFRFTGDWIFWFRLLSKGDVAFCSQTLNYFRFHDQTSRSITSLTREKARVLEYLRTLDIIGTRFLPRNDATHFNHEWMIDEWVNRSKSLPLFLLGFHAVPLHSRWGYFRRVLARRKSHG